jgi:hypothetical protein
MHTSPATQFLSPHAKGALASTAHAVSQVHEPLLGSHTGWHLQSMGHAHGGGGPPQVGGGHGGTGGHVHWPPTQISATIPPLHPPLHASGPCCPSVHCPPLEPLDEIPDDPVLPDEDTPDDPELPDEDSPEEPEEVPEEPELDPLEPDEDPVFGVTEPPQAARTAATKATARRDRGERMGVPTAYGVPASKLGKNAVREVIRVPSGTGSGSHSPTSIPPLDPPTPHPLLVWNAPQRK